MQTPRFTGIYTAVITPFTKDLEVDYPALEALIEDQLSAGIHGIVACGTTGEAATLSPDERLSVIKAVKDLVRGRVPVIGGAGHNNTRLAADLQRQMRELGVDGSLQVTPWYNKPTQEGLYRHYAACFEAASIPTILYNVPGRTASDLLPETVERLAKDFPDACAVKEATGSIGRAQDIIGRVKPSRPDFSVLSGEDTFILGLLGIGGDGVVSVISHVCPEDLVAMYDAFKAGNMKEAQALSAKLTPLQPALFFRPNPVPVKAALKMGRLAGKMEDGVRLPLVELDAAERETLTAALKGSGYL